jgi:sugar phosphate isomerase/epimerase
MGLADVTLQRDGGCGIPWAKLKASPNRLFHAPIMNPTPNRREFIKSTSLLPVCAVAGATLMGATRTSAAPTPVARVGGPKLKLSLNAYSFNDLLLNSVQGRTPAMSLFELLEFCAQHDFEALDPTGYYFPGYPEVPDDAFINRFKRRAFQLGLDISGTGIRNDFATPDAARRAADVTRAKAWIEAAAKLGAPVLRLFAGAVPAGYENKWDEVARWMADAFRECAAHGEKFGVLIGVQNHGDMLKNADECIKVLDLINSEWCGVIVDTGNMATPDPYADIARVVSYAVNWQVKESPRGPNSPERTDLPRLMRIIREGGYRGYVPIETLAAQGQPYDPHVLVPRFAEAVRAAMATG